jgi:hypothetical protein
MALVMVYLKRPAKQAESVFKTLKWEGEIHEGAYEPNKRMSDYFFKGFGIGSYKNNFKKVGIAS